MSIPEIVLLTVVFLLIIFLTVKTHKNSVKNEIELAKNTVREYLTIRELSIDNLISDQRVIKVKGLHVGIKIKAIVVNNKGIKLELILIYNSITNNIKTLSEMVI